MINYHKVWSSVTKTLRIICKSSKEFINSKINLERWKDSVEPVTGLLCYQCVVIPYLSQALLHRTSACVPPSSSTFLAKCKEH